jgi:hypothetical protein
VTVGELLRAFARAMPPQDRPAHVSDARSLEVDCTGVAYDSRRVAPGMVFVAIPGLKADGLQFVSQAITSGAAAIVAEQPAPAPAPVPWVVVTSARLALALISAEFFEHPSAPCVSSASPAPMARRPPVYLTASVFEAAGLRCGLMGTVTYRIGGRSMDATRTTPEAPELQSFMRRMVARRLRSVRDGGVVHTRCRCAEWTESTSPPRLHESDPRPPRLPLEHGGLLRAKRRLFEMAPADAPSIINMDDPRAPALIDISRRPVTYGNQQAGRRLHPARCR